MLRCLNMIVIVVLVVIIVVETDAFETVRRDLSAMRSRSKTWTDNQ